MQVVAVGAVVVGGKDAPEIVAGAVSNVAEEQPVALVAPPALDDGDRPAIGEREALNVQGIGVRVFAQPPVRPAGDAAALIRGRGQFDARNVLPIAALRGGANHVALPHHQGGRGRAAAGDRG